MTENKKLKEVLDYLKEHKKVSIVDLANILSVDESLIRKTKSDKTKIICDDWLDKFKERFGINPNFLQNKSDFMFDLPNNQISTFEKLVNDWDIIEDGTKKYIHFVINKGFYDLLIELYKIKTQFPKDKDVYDKLHSKIEKEISSENQLNSQCETLKQNLIDALYTNDEEEEYILIPRNNFLDLVTHAKNNAKNEQEYLEFEKELNSEHLAPFEKFVDMTDYIDYPENSERKYTKTLKFKKKSNSH